MSRARAFDPVLTAQGPQSYVAPVGHGDLDIIFTACIHSSSFFADVSRYLKYYHFDLHRGELPYQILWTVLLDFRERFPHSHFVASTVFDMTARRLEELSYVGDLDRVALLRQDNQGIIGSAFFTPPESVHLDYARERMRALLTERAVMRPLSQLAMPDVTGRHVENLPELIGQISEYSRQITSLDVLPVMLTVPVLGSEMKPASVYHNTGLAFIDNPLGGQREGDCNGLIGATGAGKSTLAAHLTVSTAKLSYKAHIDNNVPLRLSVLFTYEESARKCYPRVWSAAMQIKRSKLEKMSDFSILTTRENMDAYEQRLVADIPQSEQLCERERWALHAGWMNETIVVCDMSGSEEFPAAGNGYVPEMSSILERLAERYPIGTICVDWAGLVCQRHMAIKGESDDKLRYWLNRIGDDCRRQMAEKFRATVWLFHQLKAEACGKSPTKLMHHSDASESKAFAVHLATCGCLGVPDPRTGCRRLNWSKLRYNTQANAEPVTLRINDMFAQMEDAGAAYALDSAGAGFVSREDSARFAGSAEQCAQAAAVSAGPPGMRQVNYVPSEASAVNNG